MFTLSKIVSRRGWFWLRLITGAAIVTVLIWPGGKTPPYSSAPGATPGQATSTRTGNQVTGPTQPGVSTPEPLPPVQPSIAPAPIKTELANTITTFEQIYSSSRYDESSADRLTHLRTCNCVTDNFLQRYGQVLQAESPQDTAGQAHVRLIIQGYVLNAQDIVAEFNDTSASATVSVSMKIDRSDRSPSYRTLTDRLVLVRTRYWLVDQIPSSG